MAQLSMSEAEEGSTSSSDDEKQTYMTGRRFCPHCSESVTLKTFRYHKRLHFDLVSYRELAGYKDWSIKSRCSIPYIYMHLP